MRLILLALIAVTAFAADIAGKWTASFETQLGVQTYTYDFQVDGGKFMGSAKSNFGTAKITEGVIKGDAVSFVELLDMQGQEVRIEYKGKITDDEMKLTRQVGEVATEQLVAKRVK